MKISVVIITLNEEANLRRCLESCRSLADETVILDSGSVDRTPEIAQAACAFIRGQLRTIGGAVAAQIRIQYGGSVNAENAETLLSQPDIDGALVGGAALQAGSFAAIVAAARA